MKKNFIKIGALLAVLAALGLGCRFQSTAQQAAIKPFELVWWNVFDNPDAIDKIVQDYKKVHPNIDINYRKLRYEEYEKELLNALAEDRGPDIISMPNTAAARYQSKLLPLPRNLKIAYQIQKGGIQKETVVEIRQDRALRIDELKNQFVDQVAKDVVLSYKDESEKVEDRIYALPLALDTMALYWNRDLLNAARIAEPARTWDEFLNNVKQLTKYDASGGIIQSGAAIGTANNVNRASDILSVIMMQDGAEMMNDSGAVLFDKVPSGQTRDMAPGSEALRFYTDFANPAKEAYSWNGLMPNSLDAFSSGTAAYYFGYAYDLSTIRARAPKLSFGIAPIPQVDPNNEINFANYWVFGVSNKSAHPDEAWDFVQFAAKAENAANYLETAKKPTALRSLISKQLDDIDLSVFASQVLTAKSWYLGNDPVAADSAIKDMIETVVAGKVPLENAINIGVGKVQQTVRSSGS